MTGEMNRLGEKTSEDKAVEILKETHHLQLLSKSEHSLLAVRHQLLEVLIP